MKKIVFILILFFAIGCNKNPVKEPKNLLTEETMENVLYDFYIIQAAVTNAPTELQQMDITPLKFILKKHKIDSITWVQNTKYYAGDVNNYKHLNKRVLARLEKLK